MYVKRKLDIGDLMPVIRIIGKIGISDFKKCFAGDTLKNLIQKGAEEQKNSADKKKEENADKKKEENADNLVEQVGFDVVLNIIDVLLLNVPKCEKELYSFLASMCGVSVEEFLTFPPSAFVDILQEIFTAEEAKDFFSHVSRLLNLEKSTSGISSTEGIKDQTT